LTQWIWRRESRIISTLVFFKKILSIRSVLVAAGTDIE